MITYFLFKSGLRAIGFYYSGPVWSFLLLVLLIVLVLLVLLKAGSVNGSVRHSPAQEEELIEDRGRKAKKKAMSFMFEKLEVYQRAVDLAEKMLLEWVAELIGISKKLRISTSG